MERRLVALDVAILVPPEIGDLALALNGLLAGEAAGDLRLDDSHLPHVTLVQQFVERARLDELFGELDRVLHHEPAFPLHVSGAVLDHRTIWLAVDCSPDLQRLHEQVMEVTEPFASPAGDADAFRADGETIRPRDVEWVRNYREQAAYSHYHPHVSVGHGDRAPLVSPVGARADRIAACELGRFCTCREVLHEWRLDGGGGSGR